ncbi:NAD-dependent succinate-semialdehyde dehydrogenase [Herbaspirillum lusitanum]|uniref:NAD-dependent succinate-semialdehyde dehydrogenase n=1 Tax=Herbaspirillum lusitanum TaxID=213312 RepID=A0ABW9AD24_9BURK
MYPNVSLFINGKWQAASSGRSIDVFDPATDEKVGTVAHADKNDLDAALAAADAGFKVWRKISAYERSKVMRKAAALLRERSEHIAPILTTEQGKPLAESHTEIQTAADIIEWFAEESRRTYGRLIPARVAGVRQVVEKEPIGPVAAFTPWNYPMGQAVRKVSAALAAGCSIVLKGPEETPGGSAELYRAFHDAGVPAGVINLVFGSPAEISEYLIPHPVIRKISFTGSTVVGKQLAALAALHMKPSTMELGGHAPVIVFDDADIEQASMLLARAKFRNAGQVCVSPTRFMVQDKVYDDFLSRFTAHARQVKVGPGLDKNSTMGAMANERRVRAVQAMVEDAARLGASIKAGGERIGTRGNFFEPTVLGEVPSSARAMNEEPFGPMALVSRFSGKDDAISEANRLPYGLAAYVYTRSPETADLMAASIESGMVSINHHGLALPETPFGGIKDSGHGSEGGTEAIEGYMVTKFVTRLNV